MNLKIGIAEGARYIKNSAIAVYEDIASEGPALKSLATTVKNKVQPRMRLARMELKSAINDAKEFNKQYSIWDELSQFKEDIFEAREVGGIYYEGINNNKNARHLIYDAKDVLKEYAKANKLNIIFHTPTKFEITRGAEKIEKPLNVIVELNEGILGSKYHKTLTIDGDINKISTHTETRKNSNGTNSILSFEDSLLRRIYRTIEELKNDLIEKQAKEKSFI